MARAHYIRKSRKARRKFGIKKGQPYWWWKFRRGPKMFSATKPKRSQLTRSWFYSSMYDAEDTLMDALSLLQKNEIDFDTLADTMDTVAEMVEGVRDECQEKLDNLPESLREAPSGEMLQTRIEQCEAISQELVNGAEQVREIEELPDPDEEEEAKEEGIDIATSIVETINWEYD